MYTSTHPVESGQDSARCTPRSPDAANSERERGTQESETRKTTSVAVLKKERIRYLSTESAEEIGSCSRYQTFRAEASASG